MSRILLGHDREVAQWAFHEANSVPLLYNAAVGLVSDDGRLCGAFLFVNANGYDAEFLFHGIGAMKRGVIQIAAIYALRILQVHRVTIRTRNAGLIRGLPRLGAVLEAVICRYYGDDDRPNTKAYQFVLYKETLEALAGLRKNHELRKQPQGANCLQPL
jgi:hypothetical protein